MNPLVGFLKWLIYWIVRMIITILLDRGGLSAYLCNMYVAVYMLFGIYISQNKDVFEVYSDIDHSVYKKIYEIFNSTCDSWNSIFSMATFYYVFQMCMKYSVIFLIELTFLVIFYYGYVSYSKNIKDINIKSFLYILNFTCVFLLGAWTVIKYNTAVKKLDEKYDYVVKELARKIKKKGKGGSDDNQMDNEIIIEEDKVKPDVKSNVKSDEDLLEDAVEEVEDAVEDTVENVPETAVENVPETAVEEVKSEKEETTKLANIEEPDIQEIRKEYDEYITLSNGMKIKKPAKKSVALYAPKKKTKKKSLLKKS
jgi:hypothetical protein